MKGPRRFVYRCSGGDHEVSARDPLLACPAYDQGKPCQGTLRQIAGSRKRSA